MSIEQKIAELLAESKKAQLAEEAGLADLYSSEDVTAEEELEEEAANGKTDGVTSVAGDNPDNKKNAVTDEKQAEGGTSKTANKVTAGASAPEGSHLKSVKEDIDDIMAIVAEELEQLDELSPELKQKYSDKVKKKLATKQGSRDHDAYTGRTYTGRETSDMFHRGEKLNKHLNRVKKIQSEEFEFDIQEDVNALFNGEEGFSEEFRQKAETIFEAAVMTRVKSELTRMEEEYQTQLAEQVDQVKEGLVEKVDGYLDYVVEQWMEQNEIALESGMKSDILESFVGGLKGLFEEHYIDVPEEKYDVLGNMEQHIVTLEDKLNETTEKNVELSKKIDELARQKTIEEASSGLTDTEVDKFKGLAEELSYEDQETFKTKLQTIRENYFGEKKTTSSVVSSVVSDEAVTLTEDKVVDPSIKSYLQVLNSIKK